MSDNRISTVSLLNINLHLKNVTVDSESILKQNTMQTTLSDKKGNDMSFFMLKKCLLEVHFLRLFMGAITEAVTAVTYYSYSI